MQELEAALSELQTLPKGKVSSRDIKRTRQISRASADNLCTTVCSCLARQACLCSRCTGVRNALSWLAVQAVYHTHSNILFKSSKSKATASVRKQLAQLQAGEAAKQGTEDSAARVGGAAERP